MPSVGTYNILPEKIGQELSKHLGTGETVLCCLVTQKDLYARAVVALEKRLLIVSEDTGFFRGSRYVVGSIEYLDIRNINVKLDDIVFYDKSVDLVIDERKIRAAHKDESEVRGFAEWLRAKVRETRTAVDIQGGSSTPANLIAELERLDSLYQRGALSDQEFEAAKKKLLGL